MTQRTGGNRPDYKVLGTTGEYIERNSGVRQRFLEAQGENIVDTSHDESFDSANSKMDDEGEHDEPFLGAIGGDAAAVADAGAIPKISTPNLQVNDSTGGLGTSPTKVDLFQQLRTEEAERLLREKLQEEKEQRMRWVMQQRQDEMKLMMAQEQFNMDNKAANQLIGQAITHGEDIEDFIEENPSDQFGNSVADLDRIISKVEDMRSTFRGKHNELKIHFEDHPGRYDDVLGKVYKTTLETVKKYLRDARGKRKSLRDNEDYEKVAKLEAREAKIKFLKTEVKRTISSLGSVFTTDINEKSDEDIITRKKELSDLEKTQLTIPKAIQEIIDCGVSEREIGIIKTRYEELLEDKAKYLKKLEREVSNREIEKQKTFKTSSLNIKLPKF